jgi:hypothetical protein
MPDLKNKTILILSPQSWGKMFLSKHHYAIELARRGNRVYFLNPPDQVKVNRATPIEIKPSNVHSALYLVEHKLFFPYRIKFKALSIFHWLMQFHVRNLVKKISSPVDIVWSFDLGNNYPLRFFDKRSYKIFHPVDEPLDTLAINAADRADIIFSVTNEILGKYEQYNTPRYFINHGVTNDFLAKATLGKINNPIRVGFSGNLLRNDIDRETLIRIVEDNQQCIFEFWGSYTSEQSNIGGAVDGLTKNFVNSLKLKNNVILHGVIPAPELAQAIREVDAFLICYDVQRDQSRGTNYHKVMEYIGTGKVIISNNITTYQDLPELVQMVAERDHNKALPELFKSIINRLPDHTTQSLQNSRIDFATKNTYQKQLNRIETIMVS